jgi:16S rRNA (guanine(966)-N(2))-methyltransferase RsmD
MRIIAGAYKYRRLSVPEGRTVRPTPDRVREAVFSMIAGYVDDARCLDLFAGTGSLGIEALSRGAAHCLFCEVSPDVVRVLQENLRTVGAGERAEARRVDFRAALRRMRTQFDIAFVDPPYASDYYHEVMKCFNDYGIINRGGLVIIERQTDVAAGNYAGFAMLVSKRYGRTSVDVYERFD